MPATLAMSNNETPPIGLGYAAGQLAAALVTAATHEDAATRRRAGQRVQRWHSVLAGMTDGTVTVGSRTPVAGLPAWVTPEVVRGGFATGAAAAGGPLRDHELAVIERMGLPSQRSALFAYYLSEPGMTELYAILDSGRYRIEVPEEAALPAVAWLLRADDRDRATELVDTLLPYAGQLRFAPASADERAGDPEIVWRETAGHVRQTLTAKKPNPRIESMREALTVWNPFADDLLALWCQSADDTGRVGYQFPPGWKNQAVALLDRYRRLAATHTWCSKHRKPKENMAILRGALEKYVAGTGIGSREARLLQHAVDSMLRRRGPIGSDAHTALRERQAADAARPTHQALAVLVAGRVAAQPAETGIADTAQAIASVASDEAAETGLPPGAAIPPSIARVVRRAQAGTPEELIAAGVIGSAEVLATLVPQLSAATIAVSYPDPALQTLAAAHYRAFRNRRSLLLLNLEHQVRIHELPWIQALNRHRRIAGTANKHAAHTLRRLGGLVLNGFPATVLPNPMITELATLSKQANIELPWVEELAADIFMGTFSAKFLHAAKTAAELLHGSLYERYYGIDYAAVSAIDDTRRRWRIARTSTTFDALCHDRASNPTSRYSVAANGMVIEQAQILTTHNLATLVAKADVTPAKGWDSLAQQCLNRIVELARQLDHNPRPLRTVKDLAYAWRHMLFYLSQTAPAIQRRFVTDAQSSLNSQADHVQLRLQPALDGLSHILDGGSFDQSGTAGTARRLLGWSTNGHWLLQPNRPAKG
ncbi:hypothetical protein [Allorhizocola rhizosphaerae]|uniref:hypothetical protein n=1 Tax=Allorhizocola rhizosphaerae TaxID=1872709 RepID=UPI001B8CE73D|nr:hypothetical protein [Allorhizocola rhizosphaerae]